MELLVVHLPNLVRVRQVMRDFDPLSARRCGAEYWYMHLWLEEFDIGFPVVKGRSLPRGDCLQVLRTLTATCPALEVVRFGALFPIDGGGVDERNGPPDWLMDMRQTAEEGWEERR